MALALLIDMLLTLLLVAAAAPQKPTTIRVEPVHQDPFYPGSYGPVEAPTQPTGTSSAEVLRGPRITPQPAAGASGRIQVRVGEMVAVRGQETNVVQGIGLVTGLAGTGDSATAAKQSILNMLKTQNIILDLQDVNSANVAVVLVQAELPPGIKPGRLLDVRASSIYDCESLVGGTLLFTELMESTGRTVYVTASGPMSTGAFSAEGQGASVSRNHLTVGTVPMGGKVERAVPTTLVSDHGFLYLDLKALKGSFTNVKRIADSVNQLYPGAAVADDAMTVAV